MRAHTRIHTHIYIHTRILCTHTYSLAHDVFLLQDNGPPSRNTEIYPGQYWVYIGMHIPVNVMQMAAATSYSFSPEY